MLFLIFLMITHVDKAWHKSVCQDKEPCEEHEWTEVCGPTTEPCPPLADTKDQWDDSASAQPSAEYWVDTEQPPY